MKTTLIVASLLLAFTTAACEDSNAKWEKDRQASVAKWWEDHDKHSAEMDAYLAKSAIEENTQALRELNSKLRR